MVFKQTLNKKELCPYAFELYNDLLEKKNTDIVLISKDYFNQLFCFNIKFDMPPVNGPMVNLISKMSVKQFSQEGSEYREVIVGPWDKSPKNVYLQKFRCVNKDQEKTIYIFYILKKNDKTDVIKVQLSTLLENTFEDDIYKLVLKNV